MSRESNIGAEFADKYLGHEESIVMDTIDARYRYYQWLREWYGMGQREATNKCPFYQFMFFGSILMLASIIPIILMKLVEVFILKPLSWVAPSKAEDLYEEIDKSKMIASWIITVCLLILAIISSALFSGTIIAWVGLVVHVIFAIPILFVLVIWEALAWVFVEAIPWVFYGIGFVFSALFTLMGQFFTLLTMIAWGKLFIGILWVVGLALGGALAIIVLYKLGVWFFSSGFTKWVIKKSCKVREARLVKKIERRKIIRQAQEARWEANRIWKEEHADEIAEKRQLEYEQKAKRREANDKWWKFFGKLASAGWKILIIFPGSIFIAIWYVLKYLGIAIGYVAEAIWWVMGKVIDVISIIWSLITETVSNHCPPIDFIFEINDTGILKKYTEKSYMFKCDNEDTTVVIPKNKFKRGLKLSTAKKGKHGTLICTICTKDVEGVRNGYYGYPNYYDLNNPAPVYLVQKFEYDHPLTPKKVKLSSEEPGDSRANPDSMV